jgi:hypothetical protein
MTVPIAPEGACRDSAAFGTPALRPSAEVNIVHDTWDDRLRADQPVHRWLDMRCRISVRVAIHHEQPQRTGTSSGGSRGPMAAAVHDIHECGYGHR